MKEKAKSLFSKVLDSISIKHKGYAAMAFIAVCAAGALFLGPLIALQVILLEIGAAIGGVVVWKAMRAIQAFQERRRLRQLERVCRIISERLEERAQVVEVTEPLNTRKSA